MIDAMTASQHYQMGQTTKTVQMLRTVSKRVYRCDPRRLVHLRTVGLSFHLHHKRELD
jgi:hypothetical protein